MITLVTLFRVPVKLKCCHIYLDRISTSFDNEEEWHNENNYIAMETFLAPDCFHLLEHKI